MKWTMPEWAGPTNHHWYEIVSMLLFSAHLYHDCFIFRRITGFDCFRMYFLLGSYHLIFMGRLGWKILSCIFFSCNLCPAFLCFTLFGPAFFFLVYPAFFYLNCHPDFFFCKCLILPFYLTQNSCPAYFFQISS